MNQQELQQFLEKMASGANSDEEYRSFTNWVEHCSREEYEQMLICWERVINNSEVSEPLDNRLIEKLEFGLDQIDEQAAIQDQQFYPTSGRQKTLWPLIAAASVLLFLSVGGYFLFQKKAVKQQISQNQIYDIAPGGNKAILKLANGQKIVLDNAADGIIANQGNTTVNKKQNGQLVYNTQAASSSGTTMAEAYDTLTTPRAGVYHITLADGSKIWLNAATSIRYPASFTGKYRTVELLYGEAYYDVKHNDKMPFRVIAAGQQIEDIGTHFNINAYKDEPAAKITLLEGSVKISKGHQSAVLKPGQQSQVNAVNQNFEITNDVNTEEITAWKNGMFQFTDANIQTVMRQLARWYDVDVVYEGQISKRLFTGDIHRNIKVSEAMQILTYLNINYKITGKKVIITSNKN